MLLAWLRSVLYWPLNLVVGLSKLRSQGFSHSLTSCSKLYVKLKLLLLAMASDILLFLLGYGYDHLMFSLPFARH